MKRAFLKNVLNNIINTALYKNFKYFVWTEHKARPRVKIRTYYAYTMLVEAAKEPENRLEKHSPLIFGVQKYSFVVIQQGFYVLTYANQKPQKPLTIPIANHNNHTIKVLQEYREGNSSIHFFTPNTQKSMSHTG